MMERLIDVLVARQILEADRKDEYVYVMTMFVQRTITYAILFGIALVWHKVLPAVIFLLSFILLRRTTGGFHLNSYPGCLVGTVVIFCLSLGLLAPFLQRWSWSGGILMVVSSICILSLAPVNHPALCLTEEEIDQHRKWCRIVLLIQCAIVVSSTWLGCNWQHYLEAGVLDCAVLVIIAKILRQEVKVR